LKLIQSINLALGNQALQEDMLQKAFDKWWPEFEKKLLQIKTEAKEEHAEVEPKRTDSDKLNEILNEVRQISRGPSFMEPLQPTYNWERDYYPQPKIVNPGEADDLYEYEYTGKRPDIILMTPNGPKAFHEDSSIIIKEVKKKSDKKKKKIGV
jgi:hypothetical protein